jgi:hypothetical protein
MREIRTSGQVGAQREQSPGATRPGTPSYGVPGTPQSLTNSPRRLVEGKTLVPTRWRSVEGRSASGGEGVGGEDRVIQDHRLGLAPQDLVFEPVTPEAGALLVSQGDDRP